MAARWYYARDKTRMGPYSAEQMKALASSGAVLPEDTVWREGVEGGVPARKVKHLFTAPPPEEAPALAAGTTPGPEEAPGLIHASGPALAAESVPASAAGWQQAPTRKGRASAGKGAVIVGQDGVNVKVRKKCTVCGHLDSSWVTVPIRNGTTKLTFYCPKCRKAREVEVVGCLN